MRRIGEPMAHQLICPCGTRIASRDDTFLEAVREHLSMVHPELDYSDAQIMFVAEPLPDRFLNDRG